MQIAHSDLASAKGAESPQRPAGDRSTATATFAPSRPSQAGAPLHQDDLAAKAAACQGQSSGQEPRFADSTSVLVTVPTALMDELVELVARKVTRRLETTIEAERRSPWVT